MECWAVEPSVHAVNVILSVMLKTTATLSAVLVTAPMAIATALVQIDVWAVNAAVMV